MDELAQAHSMSTRADNAPDLSGNTFANSKGALYKINGAVAEYAGQVEPDAVAAEGEPTLSNEQLRARIAEMMAPSTDNTLVQQARSMTPDTSDQITEDALILDKNFIAASRDIYEMFEGKQFTGTADEAVQYGLDTMGEFSFNFFGVPGVQLAETESGFAGGGTLAQAATIIASGDPGQAQSFLYAMGQYERLPNFTKAGMARVFRGLVNDPANVMGIASGGLPFILKQIGQDTAAMGVRKALQSLAKNPVKYSAAAGGTYSSGFEAATMDIERASGRDISAGEELARFGISTGVGTAAGATIGKVAEKVLPAVGDAIVSASDAAKGRMATPGTQLNSGVDIDPAIAMAGDIVNELRATDVSPDSIELPESALKGTLIDDLYGEGAIEPGGSLYDVAKKINERSKEGGDRSAPTPENQDIIARMMAKEILHAMESKGNAADWYKTKITNAMNIAQRIFPELSDETEASAFKFIMAITSNGADVASNIVQTIDTYTLYRQTGKMPIVGYGREAKSMEFSFNLFNSLEEQLGNKAEVFKLLSTKMKVRDLDALGKKYGFTISGENKGTEMPASVMFGPKIGGAFYQNLEGNFDMLTMDRWFMRMWGRMSGTLIPERTPEALAKQQNRVRSAVTEDEASRYGFVYEDIMNDDTILEDFASVVHKAFAAGGFKDKRELTRGAKALIENGIKVLESPGGGTHRSYMRATVSRAVELLKEQGLETDAASAQALLWYPEKELYGKLGVGNKKSAPTDYEAELAKIAIERGIDVSDITGQP